MKIEHQMFPRWLRAWHWVNAALFLTLIVTGFSLHFAGVGQGGIAFKRGVMLHNAIGVALVAAYLYYLVAIAFTGHWRQFVPQRPLFRRVFEQVRYYVWGIFRGAHHPFPATVEARFNPIQQLAYIACVFALLPLQAVSGVALLFPDRAPEKVWGMSGIWPMAVGHSLVAYASTSFLVIHLYLALTVSEPNTGVRAMVLGDREEPEEHPHDRGHPTGSFEPHHAPGE